MKAIQLIPGAVLALGLSVGVAQATSVDFAVGAGTTASASCDNCTTYSPWFGSFQYASIDADASGAIGTSFDLDEGETSGWFDFFSLTASGIALDESYSVHATLAFAEPGGFSSTSGSGEFSTFFGFISGGSLDWGSDQFNTVSLADGTEYTVELEQGSAILLGDTATVRARVTLDSVAPVPLPASALLLLAGVGGLGAMRLRKKQAAAAA
ncbi:VPLPA-CTERM sorting domain-containing protein [Gymnodinialimonas ulvae]|uniref:VPLPA-CTERM sorting domain-containing protein n=1 Tax=Gymnodinialimonas ulvae TaxID=3126504 RepID=UPI0030A5C81C